MRKAVTLTLLLIALSLFVGLKSVEARSGCCSYHGGVCGSSCCDGSPLSSICGGDLFIPLNTQPATGIGGSGQALQYCGAGNFFATQQEADNSLAAYKSMIETPLTSQVNDLTSQLDRAKGLQRIIFILLSLSLVSTLLGYKYEKWRVVAFVLLILTVVGVIILFA